MPPRLGSLVYVVAGVFFSIFLFVFGFILLTGSRGDPLTFWVLEIVALAVVWAVVFFGVKFDLGAEPM